MATTITAIYQEDAGTAFREFFTDEFRTQQLGQPGRWLAWGPRQFALIRALTNPVRAPQVEKLIARAHGDGLVGQPVAWRLVLEAVRDATTLWALSPKPVRERIEQAHESAVQITLIDWLAGLCETEGRVWKGGPSAALALFQSGTGKGQVPHLHTTAFLFNTTFGPDAAGGHFPAERVVRSRDDLDLAYWCQHRGQLSSAIGHASINAETFVPCVRFHRLFQEPLGPDRGARSFSECGGPYTGEDLFTQWRGQAQTQGFGPARLEAVRRGAREAYLREWAEIYGRRETVTLKGSIRDLIRRGSEVLKINLHPRNPVVSEEKMSPKEERLSRFGRSHGEVPEKWGERISSLQTPKQRKGQSHEMSH